MLVTGDSARKSRLESLPGGPDNPKQDDEEFAEAIVAGLSAGQKTLPCRFLYDERGSDLFEQITELPEYYPTRAEAAILEANAADMAQGVDSAYVLVEFGSGSSRKTEILLDAMPDLGAYVPIDVSPSALDEAEKRLKRRYADLDIRPIIGDFSRPLDLPDDLRARRRIGFFPGSTIGNLVRSEAVALLDGFRRLLGRGSRLIVGIDLVKSEEKLVRAYDDSAGVTAAFNLNLLARINEIFGPVVDPASFHHEARFNRNASRIEMHLVSKEDQTLELLGHRFSFQRGETIHTESSHKYTIPGFQELARSAGWSPERVWTDGDDLFSVHELIAASPSTN